MSRTLKLKNDYLFFFLCLFARKRFFRLWVFILRFLRFFPQGIKFLFYLFINSFTRDRIIFEGLKVGTYLSGR